MTGALIVNIDVPDLVAGIAFYETGLGFRLRRKLFDNAVAEMDGAGGCIYLIEQPAGSAAAAGTSIARDYAAHWTPVHLDLAVDDVDAAIAQALAAGAKPSGPVSRQAFGDIAPMRDPFGHGFCLIAFNEGGYDAVVSE